MIRAVIVIVVAFVLSFGTALANDLEVTNYCETSFAAGCTEEGLQEGGFPIQFTSQSLEIDADFERVLGSDFNIGAFILNSLVWVGVVSVLYMIAIGILKSLGKTALIAYVIASGLGYSISVGTWF